MSIIRVSNFLAVMVLLLLMLWEVVVALFGGHCSSSFLSSCWYMFFIMWYLRLFLWFVAIVIIVALVPLWFRKIENYRWKKWSL